MNAFKAGANFLQQFFYYYLFLFHSNAVSSLSYICCRIAHLVTAMNDTHRLAKKKNTHTSCMVREV